jgi:ribonucleoside-diphosphate reductase alpha chain
MTQTSSGIEPVFMPVYQRRRKVNPNDQESVVTFVDETGDAWEEYNVFHHHFMTWLKTEGHDPIEVRKYSKEQIAELVAISPYYKASSNDVDWVAKVKMQGRIQKWIDHSISVTINLPSDVNTELVGTLYQTAWAEGCKGVTVYRDGSRNGVLLTGNEKKVEDVFMTKRPAELEADVIHFQNNNERWVAFIGIRDGRPYEVFTGIADMEVMPVPKTITKGIIIKNRLKDGSKRYDFRFKNRLGNDVTIGGLSHQFNPEYWNYAKLISGVLRHGMPVVSAVNLIGSLHLDSDTINTWKNGVERALKRYIPDGTKAEGKQKCQSCGSHNLIYQEGCLTCQDCGNSKCG